MLGQDFMRLLPDYTASVGATAVLIVGALGNDPRLRDFVRWLSLIFVAAAATALALLPSDGELFSGGWLVATEIGHSFGLVFCATIAFLLIAGRVPEKAAGEWYGLLLFALAGMLILARAANLPAVFMGVEILSLSLYILVAFYYDKGIGVRGAMQYLILAGFASAFLAFGMALIYAGSGSMSVAVIQSVFTQSGSAPPALAIVGVALFLVGVGFKLSAVPFHQWAGEVYEAAPATVAGLIATASKGATLAALVPFAVMLAPNATLVGALVALSVIGGNLLALREHRVHRIFAYSSIAHVGYLLLGLLAAGATGSNHLDGGGAILFYVAAYSLSTLGAFAILGLLDAPNGRPLTLRDLRGVAKRNPALAFALMVFVVSMSGLPPTIGFHGKLSLFTAAYDSGFGGLVITALVGSAIGLFFYLRVIVHLYMMPSDASETGVRDEPLATNSLLVAAISVIVLSLFPGLLSGLLRL